MSSNNLELELSKQFRTSQEKYIYFLLAAAGSAIGFALTQLEIEPLTYIHILLGFALLFWLLSFISGLYFIEYSTSIVFQNQNYIAFKRELNSNTYENKNKLLTDFEIKFSNTVEKQLKKMEFYGNIQSKFLLCGTIFYIAWYIVRMWIIS